MCADRAAHSPAEGVIAFTDKGDFLAPRVQGRSIFRLQCSLNFIGCDRGGQSKTSRQSRFPIRAIVAGVDGLQGCVELGENCVLPLVDL